MKQFYPQTLKSAASTIINMKVKGLHPANHSLSGIALVLSAVVLSACSATNSASSDAAASTLAAKTAISAPNNGGLPLSMKTGYGHGSEIASQIDDGGWVLNIPGKAHTHKVLLRDCPAQPIVTHHTHNKLNLGGIMDDLGEAAHKHNGCFVCPPVNSLVKRITSQ